MEEGHDWYTVVAFRDLAMNLAGRLRIRKWEAEEKSGTTVEVEATTVGHDLRWGEAQYTCTRQVATVPTDEPGVD